MLGQSKKLIPAKKPSRRPRIKLLLTVIMVELAILGIPLISDVRAAGPVVEHTNSTIQATCTGGCAPTLNLAIFAIGDLVAVTYDIHTVSGTSQCPTALSITDNQSNTYTTAINTGCTQVPVSGTNYWDFNNIYFTGSTATGHDLMTFHATCPASFTCTYNIGAFDVNSVSLSTEGSSTGSGTVANAGTTNFVGTFTPFFALGSVFVHSDVWTAGGGFTQIGNSPSAGGMQYATSASTVGLPTNFPFLASNGPDTWIESGAVFGPTVGPSTVQVVQACTFFQLQCWLYPTFFMGLWLTFFIAVSTVFKVSEKAFLFLMLTGATYGSMVEINLGIMTPLIPISLIVVTIGYSFRVDRLIRGANQSTA